MTSPGLAMARSIGDHSVKLSGVIATPVVSELHLDLGEAPQLLIASDGGACLRRALAAPFPPPPRAVAPTCLLAGLCRRCPTETPCSFPSVATPPAPSRRPPTHPRRRSAVWEFLESERAFQIVNAQRRRKGDATSVCAKLVQEAGTAWAREQGVKRDDITAICFAAADIGREHFAARSRRLQ